MLLPILLLFVHLTQVIETVSFDGVIHRSSDGSSYAFLSPPKTGNHASFIEQMTPTGTLAVAWFTGGESIPNCSIALSLLEVGSYQFTPGVIVSERVNYSNQNPVLYWDNGTQILHLYHTTALTYMHSTPSELWHLQSTDRGATWSTSESFYTAPGVFDRNRIIPSFNKSELLFPCYNDSSTGNSSFILRLSSPTSILTRNDIKDSYHLVQPTVIRLNDSLQLRAFFRDARSFAIYYSDSNDDGLTWSTPQPTSLPNNNAGTEAYTLKNGAVIMAFNNLNGTGHPRSPLTVALSYDNGMTWPYKRDVQVHDDDNSTRIAEYSYPSLLQSFWSDSDDNDIHLVYTYGRETIKYLRFNEKWVKQGQ